MKKAIIKLAWRQVIDIHSESRFEKDVFNDTYLELLMQAQAYNPGNKLTTFKQLIDNNPKANSLHYKVGFCIGLYVKDLQNKIPRLTDLLGDVSLPFESVQFQVLESDLLNRHLHKVALTYTSMPLYLHSVIADKLLLSIEDNQPLHEPVETFMLALQPGLSICSFAETCCQPAERYTEQPAT